VADVKYIFSRWGNVIVAQQKGHIRSRGKNSWAIYLYFGRDEGGKPKYRTRTFRGSREEAGTARIRRHGKPRDGAGRPATQLKTGDSQGSGSSNLPPPLDVARERTSGLAAPGWSYANAIRYGVIVAQGHRGVVAGQSDGCVCLDPRLGGNV